MRNIEFSELELETMFNALNDQANRLESDLKSEFSKVDSDPDEILFYATELSKARFLAQKIERLSK